MNLQSGMRIGPYEVMGFLGAGGMGAVYHTRDTVLGREVALKILPPEFTSDEIRLARFQQEARLASSLNHPNIVTIYGVGTDGGVSYIAMELVRGKTIAQLIAEGPLEFEKALNIATQITDGLAKAHSAGIVHRDLKPHNVMINEDGLAKILDFGLSKLTAIGQSPGSMLTLIETTTPGVVMGTAKYMSPEQANGKALDFRSDQFSFGCLLYEMLAGRAPFEGETLIQILSSVIQQEPPRISKINPKIPASLEQVVERCLAKNPDSRYPSTQDLNAELQLIKTNPPGAISRPGLILTRIWRRRQWRPAAAFAAALLIAIIAVLFFNRARNEEFQVNSIPAQKQVAILPLTDLDGGTSNQALLEGLVETLSSKLGQLERFQTGFRVIPASEVRRQNVTTPQAARQTFGVTLVINGTVQRTAEALKLTLSLIDPKEMRQRTSRSMDLRLDDARALQDGLLVRVAEILELDIKPEARKVLAAGGTTASFAYESYLQGRGYLQRYEKIENVENAIGAFQQALGRDPNYPLAYAGVCEAFWRKYDLTKDTQLISQARQNCMHAIELDAGIASVHVTNAMLHTATGEYEEAVTEARKAIDLDNTNAGAYRELARAYQEMGKSREAEATYKKVIEVRPDDFSTFSNLGAFYYRMGQYSDAATQFREVIRLTPDNSRAYSNLGGVYFVLKRYDEAIDALQKSLDLQPSSTAYSNLGTIYYTQGRYEESAKNFERAIRLKEGDFQNWRNLGEALSWVPNAGEKSKDAYRHAVELGEKQRQVNSKDARLLKDLADSYANLGERQKAQDYIRQALSLKAQDVDTMKSAASIYEVLGQRDLALDLIGKAFRNGLPRDAIDNNPGLAGLRADPRFQSLRER